MPPRPPLTIDAPTTVNPRRSGLFLAATGPMDMDGHIVDVGAQWFTDSCGSARLYPAGCMESGQYPYVIDPAGGLEAALPFNVYASTICAPAGTPPGEDRARVLRRLQKAEERQTERALWGGQAANGGTTPATPAIKGMFQLLSEAGELALIAGTAPTVKAAVALLEQQAADSSYDGPLIIHARPGIAAYAGGAGIIKSRIQSDGEHQYTHAGAEWSFGQGYSGASPDNATTPDATTEYMYITGRVFVWRSPDVQVSDPGMMFDEVYNQRPMVANRPYAIAVDCFAAAVKVTRA